MSGPETVMAYSHYLVMKGQSIGLAVLDGHKPEHEELELQREMRRTCDSIAGMLPECDARHIADLTSAYTVIHMAGLHELPDTEFVNAQRDRLFRCWKSGDKTIEESSVYSMLFHSVPSANIPAVQQHALDNLRGRWLSILKRKNTFADTTAYELYSRLSLIIRDNIDSCFHGNGSDVKKAWYEENKITDITTVGSKILTSYRRFVNGLHSAGKTFEQVRALDIVLLKELVTRKDLNEYDRKAYRLALEFETRHGTSIVC